MIIKSKKAVNEIITTIIIMLIMVIVVGIIIRGISSQVSKSREKLNYDNSIKVRDLVYSTIMEVYNSPIEATKEINFSLSNLELVVDSDSDNVEVCFIGKSLKFFADGKRIEEDNNKYAYRALQKVCSGVAFENIDLVKSVTLNNKEQARLVFKKITDNKISVSIDNETSASWYTQKNEYVYDEDAGDWVYRKKIIISSGNVIGDLNYIPVTITLTDEDFKKFAKEDGSDLLFTLSDGVTKLKKKIVSYNSETGELKAILTVPNFKKGTDVNVHTYDEKTRKKITIDHSKVDGDLVDFPVLISIKDENLVALAKVDGSDIYFTASDGTTRLKREIEDFTDINLFRKKITIDHTKVESDLNDFPVLLSIRDEDLLTYAKDDGSDIYFTTSNGNTRLKREIESFTDNKLFRKKITIDHTKVDGNLNDFPVLISIRDEDLITHAKEDGSDIYFTTSNGNTRLKREIESFTNNKLFRKKITIDHTKVDSDLNDFPVLISITDSDLATYGANADGNDIYFTFNNRSNKLKREIEDYNLETGTLVAWVKIPELSSTNDTDIYMHFGNENENNSNDADVWDSNTALVQHFNDNVLDSTIYANDGTEMGSPEYLSGITGKAMYFDGVDDWVNLGEKSDDSPLQMRYGSMTIEHWIKPAPADSYTYLFLGSAGGGWKGYGTRISATHFINAEVYGETGGRQTYYKDLGVLTDEWNHVVVVFDRINNKIIYYINGTEHSQVDITDPGDVVATQNFVIGSHIYAAYYKGSIDEFRVSNSARSGSWIKTGYNNQSSPSSFYSVGELENVAINLVAWVKIPELSSTNDTDIYMYFGNENENNSDDTDVWDENYIGVWHNTDYNATHLRESKSGLLSATKVNQPTQTIGKIGAAQYFNGINDTINTNMSSFSYTKSTISFWANFENIGGSYGNCGVIFGSAYWRDNDFSITQPSGGDSRSNYRLLFGVGTNKVAVYHNEYSNTGEWYYFSFAYDSDQNEWGDALKTHVNGVFRDFNYSRGEPVPLEVSGTRKLGISAPCYFNGMIDEVRFSSSLRSESWVKTEYNNQSAPSSFYSVGELEDVAINLVAWVKIPELSSTNDTDIYMYFGNREENNSNDADVWDENFATVLHFNNSTLDSTANNINGSITGNVTLTSDRFNSQSAYSFDTGNYITIPKPFEQDNLEQIWTVDAWYKIPNKNGYQGLFKRFSFNNGLHIIYSTTEKPLLYLNSVTVDDYYTYGNGDSVFTDTWQKITFKFRNSDGYRKIFVDGVDITTSGPNKTSTPSGIDSTVIIGDPYTGELDELRISTTLRSDEWIKTEYNNQSAPSSFYSVGGLEDMTINLVAWVKIPELSSTNDTHIYMYFGDENENNSDDADVWDDNFVGVWHNKDYNATHLKESKSGLISATKVNQPTQTAGKVGPAQYFNGINNTINTNLEPFSFPKSTISFWANFENIKGTYGNAGIIFGSRYWQDNDFSITQHSDEYKVMYTVGKNKYAMFQDVFSNTGEWYYFSFAYDSDQEEWVDALKTHINGELRNFNSSRGETVPLEISGTYNLAISQYYYFTGLIDEVRLSNALRSESWVKTEYNNQSSPNTFLSVGEMADANVIVETTPTAANASTGLYVYFGNPNANVKNNDIKDGNTVNVTMGILEKS